MEVSQEDIGIKKTMELQTVYVLDWKSPKLEIKEITINCIDTDGEIVSYPDDLPLGFQYIECTVCRQDVTSCFHCAGCKLMTRKKNGIIIEFRNCKECGSTNCKDCWESVCLACNAPFGEHKKVNRRLIP